MKPRRVFVEEARPFWAHVSQLEPGLTPEMITGEGLDFWACGPICGAFRDGPWPGVLMADYGVDPSGFGQLVTPAKAILNAVWADRRPSLIVGWTDARKRAALAFSKRIGFRISGQMTLEDGTEIIMQEWGP